MFRMIKYFLIIVLLFFNCLSYAQTILSREKSSNSSLLANSEESLAIIYDPTTSDVVKNTVGILIEDLDKLGLKAALKNEKSTARNAIIVGTVNDPLIQAILKKSK